MMADTYQVLPSGYKHRPQVIKVEFPAPPVDISRSSQLVENGPYMYHCSLQYL